MAIFDSKLLVGQRVPALQSWNGEIFPSQTLYWTMYWICGSKKYWWFRTCSDPNTMTIWMGVAILRPQGHLLTTGEVLPLETPLEQCPIPNTNRVTHITQLRYTGISTAEDGNPMIKTGQYPFEALAPRQEVDDGNIDGWHPNISGDSQFPVDFPLNSSRQSIHWIVVGEYPHFWWP